MPSLAALMLATALVSDPERGCDRTPRASLDVVLELELPLLEQQGLVALTAIAEHVYTSEGWFGIAIDEELALLVDLRMDGPASRGAFSASFGIALTRWDG